MPKNRYKNAAGRSGKHAKPHNAGAPRNGSPAATRPATTDPDAPAQRPMSPAAFMLGLLAILVGLLSSGMLALSKFEILALPGCGPGSGCDQAAASQFGNLPIPGLDITWPLSFVGVAYFLAIGVAWIANRRGLSNALRFVLVCGGIGSLFYLTIMFAKPDLLCAYCLATHVANFVLIATALLAGGFSTASSTALATAGTAFFVATCTLFVADRVSDRLAADKGEQQLAESMEQLTQRTEDARQSTPGDAGPNALQQPERPTSPDLWKDDRRLTWTGRRGFTGNYLEGPEDAPIRIVIFSDYQCEDCKRVHEEVQKLLAERSDVSYSHKHFPFCKPCNPKITGKDLHENACWASVAAEVAGKLHGPEGFWKMHDWLFDRRGAFTNPEFNAGLQSLGWDVQQFVTEMTRNPWVDPSNTGAIYPNREYVEIVRADAQEGADLGLFYTPMMFVNGVQIRGFRTPNVLTRAVEALALQNPPPGDATQDWPSGKVEKYVGDYFSDIITPRHGRLGDDLFRAVEGPQDRIPVEMQAFVSYRSPYAAELQRAIDRSLENHPGKIRVIYRHYPVTKACNPKISAAMDEGEITCTMSKALEAVGQISGAEAYAAMHRWTLENQDTWSLDAFASQAQTLGIDQADLRAKAESPEVERAVLSDIDWLTTVRLGAKAAIFINNKHVYNWNMDGLPIVETIVDRIVEVAN